MSDHRPVSSAGRSHRSFVSYIDRSRAYYAAQGYDVPYRWATHESAPFTPLSTAVADAVVGVVTTAARTTEDRGRAYAESVDPAPAAMETAHLSWHQEATHTDDLGTFLPLAHLEDLSRNGEIGRPAARFYGLPTDYSHRRTRQSSADIVKWAHEDDVDLMLLIPL